MIFHQNDHVLDTILTELDDEITEFNKLALTENLFFTIVLLNP